MRRGPDRLQASTPPSVGSTSSAPSRPRQSGGSKASICTAARICSNIRVNVRYGTRPRMGDLALLGVADGLRVFPQRPRLIAVPARGPGAAALGQFGIAQRDVDRAGAGVDRDLVAVAQQR